MSHADRQRALTGFYRSLLDNAAMAMSPVALDLPTRDVELNFGPPFSFTEGDGAALTPPTVRNELTQRATVGWKTPGYDEWARDVQGGLLSMQFPMSDDIVVKFIDGRWVVVNAKEDTMAKRGAIRDDDFRGHLRKATSAKQRREDANARRRAKRADVKRQEEVLKPGGEMDQAQTAAEALQQAAPVNPEAEAVGMLIAIHLLTCLGVGWSEIGELLGISSSSVADRAESGAIIARRMGVNVEHYAARNRIIRENMMGDFAREAARAMQERIVVALPAFLRAASDKPTSGSYNDEVLRLVKSFTPEDVIARVKESPLNTGSDMTGSVEGLRAYDGRLASDGPRPSDEQDKLDAEAHRRFGSTTAATQKRY